MWNNPNILSYAALSADFRSGKASPRDLLEQCLSVIDRREADLNAFVTLDVKGARAAADASAARYRKGTPLSPLDGCVIGVKDIIETLGMPTQMNSPLYVGWQAPRDAACVQALREAGAVIIGKTVTTEFAIGLSGPTVNPFDATRTPGGSSSGTAAAVGAGMIPAGLGTQTGGSTLRPASYCGAVGLKATVGALPLGGVHPLSTTCDHLGVIAGTLADAWLVASVISKGAMAHGYGVMDGASTAPLTPVRPAKLIVLYTPGWSELDAGSIREFTQIYDFIDKTGISVLGKDDHPAVAAFEETLARHDDEAPDIVACEMRWPYAGYIARDASKVSQRIHDQIARGETLGDAGYKRLLENRSRAQVEATDLLEATGADGFITLASSGSAPVGLANTGSRKFLNYASWLGFPAVSLPLMQVGHLPLGLQLIGALHRDGAMASHAAWLAAECGSC
jgi:Asp-tRNA(Asn)/Glu-tRNA(Gln) amidotransferase A subunit family amidase